MARPQLYPIKKVIGFDRELLGAVDNWRRTKTPIPSISEAIRQILTEWLNERGYLGQDRGLRPDQLTSENDG